MICTTCNRGHTDETASACSNPVHVTCEYCGVIGEMTVCEGGEGPRLICAKCKTRILLYPPNPQGEQK